MKRGRPAFVRTNMNRNLSFQEMLYRCPVGGKVVFITTDTDKTARMCQSVSVRYGLKIQTQASRILTATDDVLKAVVVTIMSKEGRATKTDGVNGIKRLPNDDSYVCPQCWCRSQVGFVYNGGSYGV